MSFLLVTASFAALLMFVSTAAQDTSDGGFSTVPLPDPSSPPTQGPACDVWDPPAGTVLWDDDRCIMPLPTSNPHFAVALNASLVLEASTQSLTADAAAAMVDLRELIESLVCDSDVVSMKATVETGFNTMLLYVASTCATDAPSAAMTCKRNAVAMNAVRCLLQLILTSATDSMPMPTEDFDAKTDAILQRLQAAVGALAITNVSTQLLPYAAPLVPAVTPGIWWSCTPALLAPPSCEVVLHPSPDTPLPSTVDAGGYVQMFMIIGRLPSTETDKQLIRALVVEATKYFCGNNSQLSAVADSKSESGGFYLRLSATCSMDRHNLAQLYCGDAVRMMQSFRCALVFSHPRSGNTPSSPGFNRVLAGLVSRERNSGLAISYISNVGDDPSTPTRDPNFSPIPVPTQLTRPPSTGDCDSWDPPADDPIYSVHGGCRAPHFGAEPHFSFVMTTSGPARASVSFETFEWVRAVFESYLCNLTIVDVKPELLRDDRTLIVHVRVRCASVDDPRCKLYTYLLNAARCLLVWAVRRSANDLPPNVDPRTIAQFSQMETLVDGLNVSQVSASLLPVERIDTLPPGPGSDSLICRPVQTGPSSGCALPSGFTIPAGSTNVSFYFEMTQLPTLYKEVLDRIDDDVERYFCGVTRVMMIADTDDPQGGFFVYFAVACTTQTESDVLKCARAAEMMQGLLCAWAISADRRNDGRDGFDANLHIAYAALGITFVSKLNEQPTDFGGPPLGAGDDLDGNKTNSDDDLRHRERVIAGVVGVAIGAVAGAAVFFVIYRRRVAASRARSGSRASSRFNSRAATATASARDFNVPTDGDDDFDDINNAAAAAAAADTEMHPPRPGTTASSPPMLDDSPVKPVRINVRDDEIAHDFSDFVAAPSAHAALGGLPPMPPPKQDYGLGRAGESAFAAPPAAESERRGSPSGRAGSGDSIELDE